VRDKNYGLICEIVARLVKILRSEGASRADVDSSSKKQGRVLQHRARQGKRCRSPPDSDYLAVLVAYPNPWEVSGAILRDRQFQWRREAP